MSFIIGARLNTLTPQLEYAAEIPAVRSLADMDELRKYADQAEALIPDKYLSYPTYGQMLFSLR